MEKLKVKGQNEIHQILTKKKNEGISTQIKHDFKSNLKKGSLNNENMQALRACISYMMTCLRSLL